MKRRRRPTRRASKNSEPRIITWLGELLTELLLANREAPGGRRANRIIALGIAIGCFALLAAAVGWLWSFAR